MTGGERTMMTAARLVAAGALLSGPGAMVVVMATGPQPAWSGVDAFVSAYHLVQVLPYMLGFGLLLGFVLFAAACHAVAPPRLRVRTAAALVFTAIYASLVFANYTIQVGYIPRMLQEHPELVGPLTMANPASFAWFLEMFGYAALGAATWLVAPLFGGTRAGVTIANLLRANGILSIIGAVCTASCDRWVFSPAGMASFFGWNLLVIACFTLIALRGGLQPAGEAGTAEGAGA